MYISEICIKKDYNAVFKLLNPILCQFLLMLHLNSNHCKNLLLLVFIVSDEMVDALKNVLGTTNAFILVFNGRSERFDSKSQQMIR